MFRKIDAEGFGKAKRAALTDALRDSYAGESVAWACQSSGSGAWLVAELKAQMVDTRPDARLPRARLVSICHELAGRYLTSAAKLQPRFRVIDSERGLKCLARADTLSAKALCFFASVEHLCRYHLHESAESALYKRHRLPPSHEQCSVKSHAWRHFDAALAKAPEAAVRHVLLGIIPDLFDDSILKGVIGTLDAYITESSTALQQPYIAAKQIAIAAWRPQEGATKMRWSVAAKLIPHAAAATAPTHPAPDKTSLWEAAKTTSWRHALSPLAALEALEQPEAVSIVKRHQD